MKHSSDVCIFQTNLLQALQKNKVIQGKLTEREQSHYTQLLKDMQVYHLKEKYNRELLYTWKKESYARQLKKNLQEYGQRRSSTKDPFYQYQVRNLGNIITGQQSLVIPPSEEERRLNINAKYHQFLQKNPLQASSSTRVIKSAVIPTEESQSEDEDDEEENTRGVERTWKNIHAQSATILRRKQNNMLPNINRSSTMNEIRRNKASARSLIRPKAAVVSRAVTATSPEGLTLSFDEKFQRSPRSPRSPTKSSSNYLGLPDGIEPLLLTSESLDKHTRADLFTMRSVRRPRKSPSDLNLLFETRKRIYQINKRALDYQLCQRKCQLQTNIQFDRPKQIDSINHVGSLSEDINENTQKQHDNKIII